MFNFGIEPRLARWQPRRPHRKTGHRTVPRLRAHRCGDPALWALLSRTPATSERPAPGRQRRRPMHTANPLCPISQPLADATKLRLVTGQRGGEVVRMRWQDLSLDAGWWTVPATDAKNGVPHRVPLTKEAVPLSRRSNRTTRSGPARCSPAGLGHSSMRGSGRPARCCQRCWASSSGVTIYAGPQPPGWRRRASPAPTSACLESRRARADQDAMLTTGTVTMLKNARRWRHGCVTSGASTTKPKSASMVVPHRSRHIPPLAARVCSPKARSCAACAANFSQGLPAGGKQWIASGL